MRHMEDRRRVVLFQHRAFLECALFRSVVRRACFALRQRIALVDVVHVSREGVVEPGAPAAGKALLEFEAERVVERLASAYVTGVDITEMRIGSQQLPERQSLAVGERTEARIAVERIRVGFVQPIPEGQVRVGQLVDIDH